MVCVKCGQEVSAAFCPTCGTASGSAPTLAASGNSGLLTGHGCLSMLGIVVLLGVVVIVLGHNTKDSTPPQKTRISLTCATSMEDIGPVLSAYENSDVMALYGLIQRGKAINLDKGETVSVGSHEGSMVRVYVQSGLHSGESCYLPEKWVE